LGNFTKISGPEDVRKLQNLLFNDNVDQVVEMIESFDFAGGSLDIHGSINKLVDNI